MKRYFGLKEMIWKMTKHPAETGTFYVMKDVDLKPLEEIFRAKIFKMLKEEGKLDDDIIKKLTNWRHSGFSVHNKVRIAKDDGLREKQGNLTPDDQPLDETDEAIEIIDVSGYQSRRIPSKQWRECIKKSMRQTLCAVQIVAGRFTPLDIVLLPTD